MIKAIFFDIDGTLLSHKTKKIPDSTIYALKQLKKSGIHLFLATGRHRSEIEKLSIQDISFDGYITLNGQYCYDKEKTLYALPIPKEDINNILTYIQNKNIPCIFVEDKQMYINFHNEVVQEVQDSISTSLPELGDLTRGLTHPIYQVIPYGIQEEQENEMISLMPHCKKTRWHSKAIDIISKEGGKENGIKEILDIYHIKQEETMAFGDGMNDIDMLSFVKIGIAMGNACQELKDVADDITEDIDHHGIYQALVKYHIIEESIDDIF